MDSTIHPPWQTMSTARDQRTQLRAGVVGLGKQALEDHIPGLLASDGAKLVAICDENPDVLREQQYHQRVPGYTDFREMLKAEQLDLVVVAVPHHVGRLVIETAAEHHVHVLKEKPFATSIDEARVLANLCEQAGIQLMVTLQRRFNPIYTTFIQLADQIGTPFVVDAQYTLHIPDPSEGWRGKTAEAGGGCIIDMGYHLIDMILWYFGQPDRILADISVSARPDRDYDAEDTALIHFAYDGGLLSDRTFAIVVTHMWGVPADIAALRKLADEHGIGLLEDGSHAHGASVQGRKVGTFGQGAAFSMNGPKPLSAGEGGFMLTNDSELYYRALLHGQYNKRCRSEIPEDHRLYPYAVTGMGLKHRVHPLAARIALDQLGHLDEHLAGRERIATYMIEQLSGIPGVRVPQCEAGVRSSWYGMILQYRPDELDGLSVDRFFEAIVAEGCSEADRPGSTCPLSLLPLFQNPAELFPRHAGTAAYGPGDFPQAEAFHECAIKLPVWHRKADTPLVTQYIEAVRKVAANYTDLLKGAQ